MTPREQAKKCKSECQHLAKGACVKCIEWAIEAAVKEEQDAILSIIAGGDRPWQELAKIIRARGQT